VKDRAVWQKVWRAAHAVGAAGLLALAAMLFITLPARAAAPGDGPSASASDTGCATVNDRGGIS
jgi:hypothetical protein